MATTTEARRTSSGAPVDGPCPEWCNVDHELYRNHGIQIVGRTAAPYGSKRAPKSGRVQLWEFDSGGRDHRAYLVVDYDGAAFWIHRIHENRKRAEDLSWLLAAVGAPKWLTDALGKVDETITLMWGAEHWCNYDTRDGQGAIWCTCSIGRDHEIGGKTYDLGEAVDHE